MRNSQAWHPPRSPVTSGSCDSHGWISRTTRKDTPHPLYRTSWRIWRFVSFVAEVTNNSICPDRSQSSSLPSIRLSRTRTARAVMPRQSVFSTDQHGASSTASKQDEPIQSGCFSFVSPVTCKVICPGWSHVQSYHGTAICHISECLAQSLTVQLPFPSRLLKLILEPQRREDAKRILKVCLTCIIHAHFDNAQLTRQSIATMNNPVNSPFQSHTENLLSLQYYIECFRDKLIPKDK